MVCEIKVKSKYKICINYENRYAPRVWIVEPDFSQERYLPHVYKKHNNMLCLYHPDNFRWTQDKDIKQTIIFWTLLWIEFYEVWQETGIWFAPEAEHTQPKKEDEPKKKKLFNPKYLKDYPIRL
jgi:hypothetical protein